MKTLIIGAAGFVGGHLIKELESSGHEVVVSDIQAVFGSLGARGKEAIPIDILDPDSVLSVLERSKPQWVILLAAQSSVGRSWEDPSGTIRSNILGPVNVLEAIRKSSQFPRIILIGSSEEYGIVNNGEEALTESRSLAPANPYAMTKTCQEDFALLYQKAYSLDIVLTRSFNHIGPGQRLGFVIPDFCSAITAIERGIHEPVLKVGNLDASRDFTDVRDVVRAYRLILERGQTGEVYNVGSGRAIMISEMLKILIQMAHVPLKVEIDPAKYRPLEVKKIVADISKISSTVGWRPEFTLEASLADTLASYRGDGDQEK
jgi:GDP-4-dehydro-6-deoxy-D-mannose reductase